ncbi:MAG: hypothetical protein E7358_03295 [Clostridiales bacterium]|nr:hypothetical protein [Clostridiales bacterium]
MKTITDLKPQVKNKGRVSVYLNGSYYCGLDLATAVKYRLKVGQDIEENTLVEIQRNSELQACFDSALNLITTSIKTEREIISRLIKKGYLEEIAVETVEKLKNYGYIDDFDYANRYVSTYKNTQGKRLIALKLKQKGVSQEDAEKAISTLENQSEQAYILAQKYMKNKVVDAKNLQKCYKYLLSKGFDYDECKFAIEKFDEI